MKKLMLSWGTIVLVSLCCILDVTSSLGYNGTCEDIGTNSTIPAYTNWPFRLDCSKARESWKEDSRYSEGDVYKCEIIDESKGLLHNEGLFELLSNDTTLYETRLIINNSICLSSFTEVDLRPFPNETCDEFQNRFLSGDDVNFHQGVMKGSLSLRCIPPQGIPSVIPEGANVKTRWSLDCDAYGRDGAYRSDGYQMADPDGYPETLKLHSIDFYDAGNFTCEVTYKERTLRVATVPVCIKQLQTFTRPTLTCTNEENKPPGDTVTLSCKGQIASGVVYPGDMSVEWRKADGSLLCQNAIYNNTRRGDIDRQSCVMHGDNSSVECVKHIESGDTVQNARRVINMTFKIRRLEKSDFGEYQAILRYTGTDEATWNIKVTEDMTKFYEKLVVILSSVLSVVLFLVVLCVLYKYFGIYVKIWYKRSWLWKFDRDDRQYAAYLSYFYDSAMSDTSRKDTEKIILAFQSQLESMHYNFYDEHQSLDFAVQVESSANLVENCHRMVIVLTPEYLEDRWMRFHAELGFHGIMESRMGLVFVIVPGTRKRLREKARKDKVWDRVLIALKTNRVIKWNPSMSDDKLKRHIEYVMPKLDRKSFNDCTSTMMRSVSQTTECTIIPSSPDSDASYKGGMLSIEHKQNGNAV